MKLRRLTGQVANGDLSQWKPLSLQRFGWEYLHNRTGSDATDDDEEDETAWKHIDSDGHPCGSVERTAHGFR